MRGASNSTRDGHANASWPPRQISSANANSKPHGNCLSSGMVVVRTGHPSPKRPQPRQVCGLGPVHGSMRGWGNGVSIHTVANSLQRGMFRLMFTRRNMGCPCWPPCTTVTWVGLFGRRLTGSLLRSSGSVTHRSWHLSIAAMYFGAASP
jgi:hypothetical protein